MTDAVFTSWYLIAGGLLVTMALAGTTVQRLPLTPSVLYLAVGVALGPFAAGLLTPDPVRDARLIERLTEIAILVSLFTAGLKLRVPFADGRWRLPVRLATAAMVVTIALVALTGVYALGLPVGAAVLLGAILAPTDPVLASDVQVTDPADADRLRFGLTGEAGLNDGTAFPFVMLGLGLLGLHDLGPGGWRWLAGDVVWAVAAGLAIGWGLGSAVGRLVLYLRRHHREAVGRDEFLALGLVALAYGAALAAHAYGFLAVFAAGLALRRVELKESGDGPAPPVVNAEVGGEEAAIHPEKAPAYLAAAALGFNERVERVAEVALVVVVGAMLSPRLLTAEAAWFVPLLFLVIRPLAVVAGLAGTRTPRTDRRLIGWFGIRGIGSLYYLTFAAAHGLPEPLAGRLADLTLAVVAASVVAHGVSVTPLMAAYERTARRRRADRRPAAEVPGRTG